jgi:hypothetical protein
VKSTANKPVDQKSHFGYNTCIETKKEQKMTKKHFIAMAKEISQMPDRKSARITAEAFCKVAQTTNLRFDQARFLEACGV